MPDTAPYATCPKCGHEPLPADQSLPVACPRCGIILAKVAALGRIDDVGDASGEVHASRWRQLTAELGEAARYVPQQVSPATFRGRSLLWLLFLAWGVRLIWMDYRTGGIGESFLHGPLLVFHEAGHVIFSPFGELMTVLGGTLAQLLLPAIMAAALLIRNRDPFGAALGVWLLGVSVLDVAPYVYDALRPQLILLGGHTGEQGGHDWMYLLGEVGLRQHARTLGWLTHKAGALLVLLALGWSGWILLQQRTRLANNA